MADEEEYPWGSLFGRDATEEAVTAYIEEHGLGEGRTWTMPTRTYREGAWWTSYRIKAVCNGCGRPLGDAHESEIEETINGAPMPDRRAECGCVARMDKPPERPDPAVISRMVPGG